MTPKYAAELVRQWVGLYTRGLPGQVRQDRRDEIDSDLWSQARDAEAPGHSERSVAVEILVRLLLGIPADLSWRIERNRLAHGAAVPQTSAKISVRPVALMAIFGGAGWVIWPIPLAIVGGTWAWLLWVLGTLAMALATMGLILSVQDRIRPGLAVVSALGTSIGALSIGGAYGGVIGLMLGSAIVASELGRIGALSIRQVKAHVAAAVLTIISFLSILATAFSIPWVAAIAVFVPFLLYGLSWIAIGWSLRHGVTIPERVATTT
jgi:hypothetical protein